MHHFMCLQQDGFAWNDSQRRHFREDFFPPVEMPTVPHKPWIVRNLPIPPGIYPQVCKEIQRKIDAGIYEPSNSSYRSRWFCVVKKDGTSLRLVQSLEVFLVRARQEAIHLLEFQRLGMRTYSTRGMASVARAKIAKYEPTWMRMGRFPRVKRAPSAYETAELWL
jgi:hypothetical protein